MKFFFLLTMLAACVATSCHDTAQQSRSTAGKDSMPATKANDIGISLSEREKLIRALQQLQQAIASHNKEVIAAYFPFPIENDLLQVFDVNAAFDKQVEQNNHLITRQLFLTHFDVLYDNLEMQGFIDLFHHLPLTKLKDTATKQLEANIPEGMCIHSYTIAIEDNEVTLQYGVYSNDKYVSKQQEEPGECAEYAAFWTFIFDGEKLLFNRHQVAG